MASSCVCHFDKVASGAILEDASGAHQGIAAARDDEVDYVIVDEQLSDSLSGGDEANEVTPHARRLRLHGLHDDLVQHLVRLRRLLASLQKRYQYIGQGRREALHIGFVYRMEGLC